MTRSFRNLKTFLFCFVCHVVRANKSETDLKESSCWVSASRVRFKEDFDALLRCWRWCSIETDSVIDQFGAAAYAWSFSETRSNHLFSHALTLRFLLIFQTHETATFSTPTCTFVYMEAYLSKIGRHCHLWKPFAYAELFHLSLCSFLRKNRCEFDLAMQPNVNPINNNLRLAACRRAFVFRLFGTRLACFCIHSRRLIIQCFQFHCLLR